MQLTILFSLPPLERLKKGIANCGVTLCSNVVVAICFMPNIKLEKQ